MSVVLDDFFGWNKINEKIKPFLKKNLLDIQRNYRINLRNGRILIYFFISSWIILLYLDWFRLDLWNKNKVGIKSWGKCKGQDIVSIRKNRKNMLMRKKKFRRDYPRVMSWSAFEYLELKINCEKILAIYIFSSKAIITRINFKSFFKFILHFDGPSRIYSTYDASRIEKHQSFHGMKYKSIILSNMAWTIGQILLRKLCIYEAETTSQQYSFNPQFITRYFTNYIKLWCRYRTQDLWWPYGIWEWPNLI